MVVMLLLLLLLLLLLTMMLLMTMMTAMLQYQWTICRETVLIQDRWMVIHCLNDIYEEMLKNKRGMVGMNVKVQLKE